MIIASALNEQIFERVKTLPEKEKREVLDFIEFLRIREDRIFIEYVNTRTQEAIQARQRAWLMRSLSQTVLRLSRRTLREMNPDLSEQALNVLFVRHCYGDELADRLEIYLNRRKEQGAA